MKNTEIYTLLSREYLSNQELPSGQKVVSPSCYLAQWEIMENVLKE